MFCLSDSDRFFLYPYPTDMRKSFYSLSGIVTEKMGKDVQEGDAFIFINKSLTNMKILHAEYGGLVIYNMRLEMRVVLSVCLILTVKTLPLHSPSTGQN